MSTDICLIVAYAQNGVIGRDGDMPWRLSTDLKRFKALTLGKPVVMGRKTWDSLGRPLPGRANIVITRDMRFAPEGALVCHSLDEALVLGRKEAEKTGVDCVFIIGGGEIFKQSITLADRLYVTEILADIEGDTYFPDFDKTRWQDVSHEMVPAGEKDSHATRFIVYQRHNR